MNIREKLSYSLKWISLESFIYHFVFMVHQFLLLEICGYKKYGAIGVIFSMIYLIVTITNLGLESSLSPFFKEISQAKKQFALFFLKQLAPTIILSVLTFPLFLILQNIGKNFFCQTLNSSFMFIISCIILSESIKKTLRAILYLTFNAKINMYTETISILSYIITIWIIYAYTNVISIYTIFIPMLIMSIISSLVLFSYVYRFYKSITSNENSSRNYIPFLRIFKCRLINFLNQFSHNMFSSNFLVPFFAIQFGFAQAGVFKILSHICYSITMLMRKVFGWTSDALLSQTKNLSIDTRKHIFSDINQKINHVLLGIIIFLIININKILYFSGSSCSVLNWPLIGFFIMITLIENMFISYEKFYIAEEKSIVTLVSNISSMLLLTVVIKCFPNISQLLLLFSIMVIRALSFLLLAFISLYKWNLKPNIRLKPSYIVGFFFIAIMFFIVF